MNLYFAPPWFWFRWLNSAEYCTLAAYNARNCLWNRRKWWAWRDGVLRRSSCPNDERSCWWQRGRAFRIASVVMFKSTCFDMTLWYSQRNLVGLFEEEELLLFVLVPFRAIELITMRDPQWQVMLMWMKSGIEIWNGYGMDMETIFLNGSGKNISWFFLRPIRWRVLRPLLLVKHFNGKI